MTLGLDLGLRVTPLACLGLNGYVSELLFWMFIPPILVCLIFTGFSPWRDWLRHGSRAAVGDQLRASVSDAFVRAAPYVLELLFLLYPIVTQKAFQAFSCYHFDQGESTSTSWLRADVEIECGTGVHDGARALGLLAILLYPVGLLMLFGWLLYCARHDIRSGRKTPLSKAIAFLYREYEVRMLFWGEQFAPIEHLLPALYPSFPTSTPLFKLSHQVWSVLFSSSSHPLLILFSSSSHPLLILFSSSSHPLLILFPSSSHPLLRFSPLRDPLLLFFSSS